MTRPRLRYGAALVLVSAIVGVTVAACSSDDSNASVTSNGGDASLTNGASDATAGVTDALASDAIPPAVDGGCTAGISSVLTILVDSGYRDCVTCLEAACKPELAACFSDCACTEGAISFFQCLYTGAEKDSCFAALANSGKDPQILGLYSSCGLGCAVCDTGDDEDSGSSSDARAGDSDGAADAADGGAADGSTDAGFDAAG